MTEPDATLPAAPPAGREHSALLLGTLDLTTLAEPASYFTDPAVAQTLHSAMVTEANWRHIDLYLMTTGLRRRRPVVARWARVPVRCSRIEVDPLYDGPLNKVPACMRVWVASGTDDRAHVTTEQADDLSVVTAPYSGVVAAIAWRARQNLSWGVRQYHLGPLGYLAWQPQRWEYDYRAGIADVHTPRLRRAYTSEQLANYISPLPRAQDWAVWMWLTDPRTGRPGPKWWRISERALTPALPSALELGIQHIDLDHQDNPDLRDFRNTLADQHGHPRPLPGWPEFSPWGRTDPPPYTPGLLL